MKCPRHQAEFNEQVLNQNEIDQCPECEGIWVLGAVVDKLLGPGELLKLRSLCSVKESELLCPADKHQLFEGKIGPVTVDLCPDCNGLWLDPGELETLRNRKPISPHVSTESPAGFNTRPVGASEELILYGLLGLI